MTQQDVVFDAQFGNQVQFLIDHGNPGSARIVRPAGTKRPTLQLHAAFIAGMSSAEDLHERTFAGAVFADQRQDTTAVHFDRHVTQGVRGAEPFGDAAHPQQRDGRRRHGDSPKIGGWSRAWNCSVCMFSAVTTCSPVPTRFSTGSPRR